MKAAFYKGTHKGVPGIYNRLVRWWTQSSYSHVELVFSDGMCWSSSYMDKGVRGKYIDLNDGNWDLIELRPGFNVNEEVALSWFTNHKGQKYDILGNIHFIFSPVNDSKNKWFCSEAVAAALGFYKPERYDPGTLYETLLYLNRP
jgi:hypothetical protein